MIVVFAIEPADYYSDQMMTPAETTNRSRYKRSMQVRNGDVERPLLRGTLVHGYPPIVLSEPPPITRILSSGWAELWSCLPSSSIRYNTFHRCPRSRRWVVRRQSLRSSPRTSPWVVFWDPNISLGCLLGRRSPPQDLPATRSRPNRMQKNRLLWDDQGSCGRILVNNELLLVCVFIIWNL